MAKKQVHNKGKKRAFKRVRRKRMPVRQKQVETKTICCSAVDGAGAGPQVHATSLESQRPITSPIGWPRAPQLGVFGSTRSSFEGGGSSFSCIITPDYLFEPVRENAPSTIYPFGSAGRVEGRNVFRKWEDHKVKITFPSNCQWQVEDVADAKSAAPPTYTYLSVNRATIHVLHCLVPVRFPTEVGEMDSNQTTETIKTQIKTILDNYYGASEKDFWRKPGQPCPFKTLKSTYHNRKSEATGAHLLSNTSDPYSNPGNAFGSQMMPINDNFKFTKNQKMWYIARDQDTDVGAALDLHNLATARQQWIPVTYVRSVNHDGHNTRSLNADNEPTATAYANEYAPVVNFRVLCGLTDA